MAAKLKISIGQHSDRGIKPDNEDFYGITEPNEPQLTYKGITIAIADGMSGSDAGKQASHACVISVLADYYSTPDSWTVTTSLKKILSATNSWLYSTGHSKYQSRKGVVSTLSVLIFKSNTAHIFHIGDSRIYRFQEGNLEQLTHDHRVEVSPGKNYLNRAMGIEPHLDIDYRSEPLQIGDTYLLSTDGVHDFVGERELKQLLLEHPDNLQTASETIIATAKANHSNDNLTCQIVRIEALPLQREDELRRQHADLPFPPPLEPGMILDGYRVEQELHASNRTQVYIAVDTVTNTRVILKTPSVNFDDDPLYIEHFLHEEWAGKRIRHENVLKVQDSDRPKKCIYYVTEYIEGQTIRQWIEQNSQPEPKQVIAIVAQIAKGLGAFHRMEMLHQDLKPENLMLNRTGTAKIIDFGSVKIAGIAEVKPQQQEEAPRGTLNYSAPEHLLGKRGDFRSDMYSLAVIAYEMLNGALPFGRDMPEKADRSKLAKLEFVPSIGLNPMVPIWIDGALRKALSIDPDQRFGALSEFIFDLKNPNSKFVTEASLSSPIMQRNPSRFWQIVAALSLFGNLVLIYLISI